MLPSTSRGEFEAALMMRPLRKTTTHSAAARLRVNFPVFSPHERRWRTSGTETSSSRPVRLTVLLPTRSQPI
jgi:hypothetical protein